ncbi:hypothetical protein ABT160_24320 [Streptomyces sp. NPDC001941]|uniref:DUF6197 family protein n=1 Tax=Streptomyces sp. NPDC001941 TaxID=3154659 RepID=UPI003317563A
MPYAPPSPAPTSATTPTTALTLEERLALVNTAMNARLDEAAVAHEVNIAHIPIDPFDLADIITSPIPSTPAAPPAPYATPAAALLQRAHHQLLTGGWCTGALVNADGAHCMLGAIRAEAGVDHRAESTAIGVLLDVLHRTFGHAAVSLPACNDAHSSARVPLRLLGQAAALADARGL